MSRNRYHLYRITGLQIGDMQSYVSRLFLLMTCKRSKLVFLVDNGPWTADDHRLRPSELWQLMVTKSRDSPFANRRGKLKASPLKWWSRLNEGTTSPKAGNTNWKSSFCHLQMFRDAMQLDYLNKCRRLCPELHGCVAFEVSWDDVRGMNYLNELQADPCLALEVNLMTKYEFDSLEQALLYFGPLCDDVCEACPTGQESRENDTDSRCTDSSQSGSPSHRFLNTKGKSVSPNADYRDDASFDSTTSSSFSGAAYFTPPPSPSRVHHTEDMRSSHSPCQSRCDACGHCLSFDQCVASQESAHVEKLDCETLASSFNAIRWRKRKRNIESYDDMVLSQNLRTYDQNWVIDTPTPAAMEPKFSRTQYALYSNKKSEIQGSGPEESSDEAAESVTCHPCDIAITYYDTLVIFRFSNPFLPFHLKQTITSDQKLLKMLETGLPPWVLFFQSYPVFCLIYRPWMRPFARTIYCLISIITVLIGFYDLYKNVPVLKATAAHLFGPLFEWIESWEMISRVKYLGTMLVLQNCEKAFTWALVSFRVIRQLTSLVMRPIMEPLLTLWSLLLPVWSAMVDAIRACGETITTSVNSIMYVVQSLLDIILWPFCVLLFAIWKIASTILYPVLFAGWMVLSLPFHLLTKLGDLASVLSHDLVDMLMKAWQIVLNGSQLLSASASPFVSSVETAKPLSQTRSMWRELWDNLFSKVFRAMRYILNGFAAFFTTLNRHRLSIYNNLVAHCIQMIDVIRRWHRAAIDTWCRLSRRPRQDIFEDKLSCTPVAHGCTLKKSRRRLSKGYYRQLTPVH